MPQRTKLLNLILTSLWFLRVEYQAAHWNAKGPEYYGDHLLYQRLYEGVEAEIDGLAEKMLGLDDCGDLKSVNFMKGALNLMVKYDGLNLSDAEKMLKAEENFLEMLQNGYSKLEAGDLLTMGLDDMLAAMASAHETNVYLLKRRVSA